jgi:parvulin-like peptidyl-prolyl isomerase
MFKQPAGIQISHILVNTEEEAGQILKKLKAGEDFASWAGNSPNVKFQQGGDLGTVNEDSSLVPEFLTAALKLEPGQMTEKPVKTNLVITS